MEVIQKFFSQIQVQWFGTETNLESLVYGTLTSTLHCKLQGKISVSKLELAHALFFSEKYKCKEKLALNRAN